MYMRASRLVLLTSSKQIFLCIRERRAAGVLLLGSELWKPVLDAPVGAVGTSWFLGTGVE